VGPCRAEVSACFEKCFHFTAMNVIGTKSLYDHWPFSVAIYKTDLWLYIVHGTSC